MMSFAVLLLCAVTGLTLGGSTLKPAQEVNTEDEISKEINKMGEWLLLHFREEMAEEVRKVKQVNSEWIKELSLNLEQALIRMSDVEKSSQKSIYALTDRLQKEKDKEFVVNKTLSFEVFDLEKRDLETFETIVNVQSEARSDRVRADLIEVQLNETANMTHSCLASQTQIQETMQKTIERLDLIEVSNLSARIGNIENSFKTLRQDLDYVSNRQDDTLKLTVQNNTKEIGQLQQELLRIETICSPPCENGGQCVKNVCNCSPSFTGDRCQQAVECSPPCENGGRCMRNNICKCTLSSYGDRCQNGTKCGFGFNNGDSNGGGNISSDLVWPWMAAVVYPFYETEHICDGSIVHRHFVLVSAWCMHWYENSGLSVKLGLSDLKQGTHLQVYRVHSVHTHPEFNRSTSYNHDYNIALLELEEPIQFGPFVRPVCLPSPEIPQDELFYKPQSTAKAVRLIEYISSAETASPTVLNFTILSHEECRRKMNGRSWDEFYPTQDFFVCAEMKSDRTCPHDGSPLMQSRLSGDGVRTWTQVSIQADCTSDYYFLGPRLDRFTAWVEATIEASSKR